MSAPYTIAVEINGKTYSGSYVIERGMIRVSCAYGGRSTQVGGSGSPEASEALAKIMLGELVRKELRRSDA